MQEKPALVILDLMLPGMDGLAALRRTSPPQGPIRTLGSLVLDEARHRRGSRRIGVPDGMSRVFVL